MSSRSQNRLRESSRSPTHPTRSKAHKTLDQHKQSPIRIPGNNQNTLPHHTTPSYNIPVPTKEAHATPIISTKSDFITTPDHNISAPTTLDPNNRPTPHDQRSPNHDTLNQTKESSLPQSTPTKFVSTSSTQARGTSSIHPAQNQDSSGPTPPRKDTALEIASLNCSSTVDATSENPNYTHKGSNVTRNNPTDPPKKNSSVSYRLKRTWINFCRTHYKCSPIPMIPKLVYILMNFYTYISTVWALTSMLGVSPNNEVTLGFVSFSIALVFGSTFAMIILS